MKKIILPLIILGIFLYVMSCTKSGNSGFTTCTGPAAYTDSTALLNFAKTYGITPVADTSWLYYQIIDSGSGINPVGTSKISVTYLSTFLDGTVLDTTGTTPRTFELDSLIKGWQYGLPKIQTGGRIKLLIPSALAFGCTGNGVVPPNTPVYFDITLTNVK